MKEAMFSRRVPEAAARQLATVLVNLLECEMATLEGLPKRTSKHERGRHESIVRTHLQHLHDLDVPADWPGFRGDPCPRVREALTKLRSQQ